MSSARGAFTVEESVSIDVPEIREYQSREDAELDRKLVDAIAAAEAAGNEYLASFLAVELGSHYFDTR